MGSEWSSFSPVSASPAERVLKPSSPRFSSSRRRILASSSMMRMVGIESSSVVSRYSPVVRCSLFVVRRSRRFLILNRLTLSGGGFLHGIGLANLLQREEECKYCAAPGGILD